MSPFFIASIGNPPPLLFTRHSAGHVLLDALLPLLPSSFSASRYETWRCTAYMNESGPSVVRQLQLWQARRGAEPSTLVILHDELECALGRVRLRRGGPDQSSLRGHRGLISIFNELSAKRLYVPPTPATTAPSLQVLRVGVGIGRPQGRDKTGVSQYVLAKMSETELRAVRAAAQPVLDSLRDELG